MEADSITAYNKHFQFYTMKKLFDSSTRYKAQTGIDKISSTMFAGNQDSEISKLLLRVEAENYRFTPYRQVLVLKGKNKVPREISIPGVRDRLVLDSLKNVLFELYKEKFDHSFLKTKINFLTRSLSKKDSPKYYLKLDIKNFYGTIDHSLLINRFISDGIDSRITTLIKDAIKNPTVAFNEKANNDSESLVGIPQGLPISNFLASIFMIDFDNWAQSISPMYVRYVDDVIILCNTHEDALDLYLEISEKLSKSYLECHQLESKEKTRIGKVSEGFDYLGYHFSDKKISVRESSRQRFEHSLEAEFRKYNKKKYSEAEFVWTLNLKLTGCILDENKYGWAFFFSQANDKSLFYKIDHLVQKLIKRYQIDINKDIKSVARAYHEIRYNRNDTTYIPNFDEYDDIQKIEVLTELELYDEKMKRKDIDDVFKSTIFKKAKGLQRDIQNRS